MMVRHNGGGDEVENGRLGKDARHHRLGETLCANDHRMEVVVDLGRNHLQDCQLGTLWSHCYYCSSG